MFKIETSGFGEFDKQLKKMVRNAKELEKTKSVSLDELFTKAFMKKFTKFNSFDAFLTAGNFVVNSQKDFEAIPDADMDKHVASTTKFKNWQEMFDTAGSEYSFKKLGF